MCGVAAVALVGFVSGCGQGGTPPNTAVENYVSALAEGNFSRACSMLPSAARSSLAGSIRAHTSCVAALKRCVPGQSTNASQDQTQLLYANVQTTITGSSAVADVSGTPVARAVKRVDLTKVGDNWTLASYGDGLKRCALTSHRHM